MRILLVYPEYPKTYWSFHYALQFVSKKACFPPLGLLTVAAMLPEAWRKKLVDLNTSPLKDQDLVWADYVFISAMVIQKASARKIIDRCKVLGVKVVAGGPLFTCSPEEFTDVDHLVLNEAELTLPQFLAALETGTPRHVYTSEGWPDLQKTPVPLWSLINTKNYVSMNIQYSRGCPFQCEFCNITSLYGHSPRTKLAPQLINELEAIYATGWRGPVFFVDDNFIGNRQKLKKEVLPQLIQWMAERKYPFSFTTEASINLSDDPELMELMVKAGFDTVFIGIETPNEESLVECNKLQNKDRNLMTSIKKIQQFGLQVQGGFILGFDHDNGAIFNKLVNFIQDSGIVTAMVGLLNAPKGTKLYQRLAGEGRLLKDFSGDNTDLTMNFIPRMNPQTLIKGYKRTVDTLYAPKQYYARVMTFLKEYKPTKLGTPRISICDVKALFRSMVRLGISGQERLYYWKLFFWSIFTRPRLFPLAITLSIYGFHFRKIFESYSPDPV